MEENTKVAGEMISSMD
jgi:hypothetical protein